MQGRDEKDILLVTNTWCEVKICSPHLTHPLLRRLGQPLRSTRRGHLHLVGGTDWTLPHRHEENMPSLAAAKRRCKPQCRHRCRDVRPLYYGTACPWICVLLRSTEQNAHLWNKPWPRFKFRSHTRTHTHTLMSWKPHITSTFPMPVPHTAATLHNINVIRNYKAFV